MIVNHILSHGIIFGVATTVLLLIMMVSFSPRVWGYTDYSEEIKAKVPPQTKKERKLAWILFIPFLFTIIIPVLSTYYLKAKLGGEISLVVAFMNLFSLTFFSTLGDLVILDFLIVSKITPKFVIISGTDKEDYKDMSHHYIGHIKAAPKLILFCFLLAAIIKFL